jgi:hypothetical protein
MLASAIKGWQGVGEEYVIPAIRGKYLQNQFIFLAQ